MSYYTENTIKKQNCKDGEYFDALYFGKKPAYLTNINKSTDDLCKANWKPNKNWSENLLNDLNSHHRHSEILRQNIKFKQINRNEIVAYKASSRSASYIPPSSFRNTGKHSNSISARCVARNRFIAKIKANPEFRYFFTFTINPKLYDRSDINLLKTRVCRFLQDLKLPYVMVPERHKDGVSWHFHGLTTAAIEPYLEPFDLSKKLPKKITDEIQKGEDLRNFPLFSNRFGYCSVERVRSLDAVAGYVSKYIVKSFDEEERPFYHRFFCSKGLKEPKIVQIYDFAYSDFVPVYLSEFCPKVVFKRMACGVGELPPSSEAPQGLVGRRLTLTPVRQTPLIKSQSPKATNSRGLGEVITS